MLAILMMAVIAAAGLGQVEPLALDPEKDTFEIAPSEHRYIEARWLETSIHARPWIPDRRLATLVRGTRLVVRGEVEIKGKAGCHDKPWYAVYPFGYVCSEQARPTDEPPTPGPALPLLADRQLPYRYAIVRADGTLAYHGRDALDAGTPTRTLTKGMTLAIERELELEGVAYVETVDGLYVQDEKVGWMGQGSTWSGVHLLGGAPGLAFAWVTRDKTPVHAEGSATADRVGTLGERARVALYEEVEDGDARWLKIGEGRWVRADHLNEVVILEPPAGVLDDARAGDEQWIDVDTGEQVLVAYRGARPVYATLISSGRGHPTPLGNYPIWAKVTTLTMSNQDYEDNAYMVQEVPWVLLFQGHNALHAAYWHNGFGRRKSHGCVNLSPQDARFMFDWVAPSLPLGWTGFLPALDRSVVVHVRDSSRAEGEQFVQERPVGPPDRDAEREKLEAAEKRRQELAGQQPSPPAPGQVVLSPSPSPSADREDPGT
ncbi:MAG: L,D-transpeptidase [Nannocystaceae bacterium]